MIMAAIGDGVKNMWAGEAIQNPTIQSEQAPRDHMILRSWRVTYICERCACRLYMKALASLYKRLFKLFPLFHQVHTFDWNHDGGRRVCFNAIHSRYSRLNVIPEALL